MKGSARFIGALPVLLAGVGASPSAGEPWQTTGDNGVRVLGKVVANRYVGELTATAPDGTLLLAVSFDREGTALKVELPNASMEPARAQPGRAPVTGAFGIELGTASLPELAVTCVGSGEHCLTRLAYRMVNVSLGPDDIAWTLLDPERVPKPIPGGRSYDVTIHLAHGVTGIAAQFHFAAEEECEQERSRLDGLLREKYGECGPPWGPQMHIGQCDSRGLAKRTAEVSTCFAPETTHLLNLSYDYAPKADRDRLWEALDRARHPQRLPEADDL